MDPNQIMSWAVTFALLASFPIVWFVFKEIQMRKYRRDTVDKRTGEKKILLQIVEKDRNERYSWGIKDSLVIRDVKTGDTYPIENLGFVNSWYPTGGPFTSWGLGVQKAIFIDGKPESVIRKDWEAPPVNTARVGGILRNEKVLTIASQVQESLSDQLEKFEDVLKGHNLSPSVIYSLLVLACLLGGGVAFGIYIILQKFAMLGV